MLPFYAMKKHNHPKACTTMSRAVEGGSEDRPPPPGSAALGQMLHRERDEEDDDDNAGSRDRDGENADPTAVPRFEPTISIDEDDIYLAEEDYYAASIGTATNDKKTNEYRGGASSTTFRGATAAGPPASGDSEVPTGVTMLRAAPAMDRGGEEEEEATARASRADHPDDDDAGPHSSDGEPRSVLPTATMEDLLAKVEQETEQLLLRMGSSSSVMRSDPMIEEELRGDSSELLLRNNNNNDRGSDIASIDVSAIDKRDGEDDDDEEEKPGGTSRIVSIPLPSTADVLEQNTTSSGNNASPPMPEVAPTALYLHRCNLLPRQCCIVPRRRRGRPPPPKLLLLRVGGTMVAVLLTLIMVLVPVLLVVRSTRRRGSSTQPADGAATTAGPDPIACTQRPCAFATTTELYEAVDWYFAYFLNNNNNAPMMAEESPWAVQYGYPMNAWNVSLLTDFSNVFRVGAQRTSGDIIAYTNDAANVVMADRRVFFDDAVFDISNWDVSNAQRMDFMFYGASTTNLNLRRWNVRSVSNFSYMFGSWHGNGNALGLDHWDTSGAEDMDFMFAGASASGDPIDFRKWNTRNVQSMKGMFARSQNVIGEGLRAWDVSNVRNMDAMFYLELPSLASMNATDQNITEYNGPSFVGDLSGWNVSSLRSANRMLRGNVNYHRSLCWWKLWLRDDVSTLDMFQGTNCASLDDPDQTGYCTLCEVCEADGCIPKQPKGTGGVPLSIVGRNLCMTTNYRFHFEGERVVGSKCVNDGYIRIWVLPAFGAADRIYSSPTIGDSGSGYDVCLEVQGPSALAGAPIQVSRCRPEMHATYRWSIRSSGQIEQAFVAAERKASGTGMCITAASDTRFFELQPCTDPPALGQVFNLTSTVP